MQAIDKIKNRFGIDAISRCSGIFLKTKVNKMYLNCHSYHSLRYGTIPIEVLVAQAKAVINVNTLALTDINTVTGIYEFKRIIEEENIKPIVGIEFRQNNKLLWLSQNQRELEKCVACLPNTIYLAQTYPILRQILNT
jgi:DNA polymerase III alpha subunit